MLSKRISIFLSLFILLSINYSCLNAPIKLKPAEFVINKIDISPIEAAPFENITISSEIANTGELADNYTAVLNIDGKERDKQTVAIKPSENKTVYFSLIEPDVGLHEAMIGSLKKNFNVYDIQRYLLKHDNGVCSTGWTAWDPKGQWITFNPVTVPFQINKIYVQGSRTAFAGMEDKSYTIKIWEGNFKKELFSHDYPYTNFSTEFKSVEHDINPPLIVTDNFTVDFIGHNQYVDDNWKDNKAIYVCTDFTVDSSQYIGTSWLGTNDSTGQSLLLSQNPGFAHACWIIQVDGYGNKIASSSGSAVVVDKNVPPSGWIYFPNDNVTWQIN
jgi:hypothetical protein